MEKEFKHHLYCFLNDKGAVFLNRWDEKIKQFKNYGEAINYSLDNFRLIDIKLSGKQILDIKKCDYCKKEYYIEKLTITVRQKNLFEESGYIYLCDDCF